MSASAITSAFATSTNAPPIRLTDIDKLKGSVNYKPWSLLIRQYLRVTDTWTIVEGKQAKPASPPDDVAKWLQADAAAKLILLQTIDISLLHLIEDDTLTSAASWTKLEANYAATSTLTTYYLLVVGRCRQIPKRNVTTYVTCKDKIKAVNVELQLQFFMNEETYSINVVSGMAERRPMLHICKILQR